MMPRPFVTVLLILLLLAGLPGQALAQDEVPEPFCGKLDDEDCALLAASNAAMLNLAAYTTAITYTLEFAGLDEIVDDSAQATLQVEGNLAFDPAAREAMRRLALVTREEPLQVMEAIAADPDLVLDLHRGLGADLTLTLTLSDKLVELMQSDVDEPVPNELSVGARYVDGVLYLNIAELKALEPDLAEYHDWVAVDVLTPLEQAAADGVFTQAAAAMTTGLSGGFSDLDPALIGLVASAQNTLGQPRVLEQYMDIDRGRDATLDDGQAGAVYTTEFDAMDFILSDDFRNLLTQSAEVLAAEQGETLSAGTQETIGIFWFIAPALFRDLTVEGSTTVGVDDSLVHASEGIFDWDLTALLDLVASMGEMAESPAERSYIRLTVATANHNFDVPQVIEAPEAAQLLPLAEDAAEMLEELEPLP